MAETCNKRAIYGLDRCELKKGHRGPHKCGDEEWGKGLPIQRPMNRVSDAGVDRAERLAFIKECFLIAKPICWKCGQVPINGWTLDLDHIVNRSQGGSDDPTNLQLLCRHPVTHKGCHPDKTGVPMFSRSAS